MDLKEELLLGDQVGHHWYYVAKSEAVLAYLRDVPAAHVLDVGAGSGFFSRLLLRATSATDACCVDPNYPADRDDVEAGKPLRFRRSATSDSADLVLMMDVLEHVDDDVGLARAYVEPARSSTRFLVTVPAFGWLWSGHDVFLEHKRRYTAAMLRDTLERAGLVIETCSYFFGFVLPLAAAQRAVERLTRPRAQAPKSALVRHSDLTNDVLLRMCRAEMPLIKSNRIGGLSVFCLARKA